MMKSYHPLKAQRNNLCAHGSVRTARFLCLLFVCVTVLWGLPPAPTAHAQAGDPAAVALEVEGEPVRTDVPPVIVEGRTLVPARVVAEALGATVQWDGVQRAVTLHHNRTTAILTIDNRNAMVDGQPVPMDVPPQIISDRTLVPLRFVAEVLGAAVEWDAETRTVRIWRKAAPITGLTWGKGVGSAHIRVALAEPLADYEIREERGGTRLVLSMRPAVVATDRPGYLLGDPLIQSFYLEEAGRETRLVLDLTRRATYRVASDPDQLGLTVALDYQVIGLTAGKEGQTPVIRVLTDGPVKADVKTLANPERIVIDLQGATIDARMAAQPPPIGQDWPWLRAIRAAQFSQTPRVARVVLEVAESRPYTVQDTGSGVILRFPPHLTGVRWEKSPLATRLILDASAPLDFAVRADAAARRLDIVVADAVVAMNQRRYEPRDLAFSSLTLTPAGDPQLPARAVLQLPYYLGHEVLSRPGDTQIVLDLYASPLLGKTIWVDPGHGGREPGAITASGRLEKEINLAVSLRLQRLLTEAGARVLMTRNDDSYVDLHERPRLANHAGADVFISVHANSAESPLVTGTETYYYTNHSASRRLAELAHQELVRQAGLDDRRVRLQNFVVLREAKMPAILVELGYVSNPAEEQQLLDPAWQERAAQALRDALMTYFREQLTDGPSHVMSG